MSHHVLVFGFLKKLGQLRPQATDPSANERLLGTPAVRRMKNYAAASGYAYEYFFEGYRNRNAAREYIFSASGDRKHWSPISILLPEAALESWQRRNCRTLADNERYAIAKLSLFMVFDESDSPAQLPPSLMVNAERTEEVIDRLGIG